MSFLHDQFDIILSTSSQARFSSFLNSNFLLSPQSTSHIQISTTQKIQCISKEQHKL